MMRALALVGLALAGMGGLGVAVASSGRPDRVRSQPAVPAAERRGRVWEPCEGSHLDRVRSQPAVPAAERRGRVWGPSQGPHLDDRVLVAAGPFSRGSTKGADDERPVRVRTLRAFHIDRTEVTRAMYARCVAARRCPSLSIDLATDADVPVTQVNWSEARAYCAFAGGRLPTEDEWEKAARGSDGREFPWGAGLDCARANWGNFDNEGPCAGKNPGRPVAAGSYPTGASPCGALDMAGNVWEWVVDRYDRDPARRVVRGGSCCSYFVEPRAANRNAWDPAHRDGDLGFRCVSK